MRHLNEENHVCKGIKMQKDSVGGNQIWGTQKPTSIETNILGLAVVFFWNREQVIFVMCQVYLLTEVKVIVAQPHEAWLNVSQIYALYIAEILNSLPLYSIIFCQVD